MRNRTLFLIAALLLIGFLLVSGTAAVMAFTPSGTMNGQGPGGMMGGYQQSPTLQGPLVTGVTRLTMRNFAFHSANIQVKVGTTVTWTTQDSVPHSITFKNGMKDSGLFNQGQSSSYTFTPPGPFQYYCTVHSYMAGVLTVIQ